MLVKMIRGAKADSPRLCHTRTRGDQRGRSRRA
nr:MAG TPA: hypothetical protein [Caudoviricetes sp.]DAI10942.1 MAG TPA: hypothetical protein [Caudoviricetes sp.]